MAFFEKIVPRPQQFTYANVFFSSSRVHLSIQPTSEKKNKEILQAVKVKYKYLSGKLNYLPTFQTMLEDTLRIVENNISTSKLVKKSVGFERKEQGEAEFKKLHFEALGIETNGAFGNGSKWRQGSRSKATKDLARDANGQPPLC